MLFVLYAVLILAALAVLLYVGTLWLQAMIYSEPAAGLTWRAPVAAALLTGYFVLFHFLAHGASPFNTLFSFTARQSKQFPEFRAILENHETQEFRLDPKDGTYKESNGKPWKRATADGIVEQIVAREKDDQGNEKDVCFKVDLTSDHKFKKNSQTGLQEARYLEVDGSREMLESSIGWVTTYRFWVFAGNVLLNFGHLAVWFAAFWLLLRYQWTHALMLALVLWVPVTLLLLPILRG
jgi:hypothetical protein